MRDDATVVQLSPRGQVTLPSEIRRALGLRAGDTLIVTVRDGRIVIEPAVTVPVELYSDERVAEFEAASRLTDEELERARRRWDA